MNNIKISDIISVWQSIISNIFKYSELLKQLVYISLTQQFKKSILGNAWLVIDPLMSIFIWLILHSAGMFNPGETNIPYPAYLLVSISLWTFFVGFFNTIGISITEAGRMLIEVSFPIEIKVTEKIIINIVNFIITLTFCIVVLLFFGINFNVKSLLFIPSIIPLLLFGVSLGLFFSLFEVVFFDIYLVVKRSMRLLMYLTPIVYSTNIKSGFLGTIAKYNPLTYLTSIPRDLLTGVENIELTGFWITSGIVLIIFILVVQFYYLSVNKVIEKILD